MKKRIAVTMIVLLIVGGCIPTASDIQNVGEQTLNLSASVDAYQEEVMAIKALIQKDGLISEETATRIDELNSEFDEIQPTLEEMATAVKDADYLDGDDLGNAIKGLQAANAASAPVNPYAPMIEIGLGLATLIAGGFGVKKTVDANRATRKLVRTGEGIAKFQGLSDRETASALHDIIKEKTANI